MAPERDPQEPLVDGNKNETELPIGEASDAEARAATMWRCGDCGALRDLEAGLPEQCPDCGAPREQLCYRIED
ncbi:DUF7130 family rubredoxin-like protein [Halobacterium yunchengense]|uniref:DUF7130 family rubredoxin-like protein n=1 Tax=Halobacterium yunchengense TaxID=3108497 RepID=UPI00300A2E09